MGKEGLSCAWGYGLGVENQIRGRDERITDDHGWMEWRCEGKK